jgi:D-proline reductase (dithiol) PrdB
VGLIQREIESAGIATISISLSREISVKVRPPRTLFTGLPLGHPLSFPGQKARQMEILRLLLKLLWEIQTPGTLVDMDLTAKGDPVRLIPMHGKLKNRVD